MTAEGSGPDMRYPHFAVQAVRENHQNLARLFRAIWHAEYVHAGDHYRELKHLEEGRVCEVCGHTLEGDAPAACTLCGATEEQFTAFHE
jgi:rubrerythrin